MARIISFNGIFRSRSDTTSQTSPARIFKVSDDTLRVEIPRPDFPNWSPGSHAFVSEIGGVHWFPQGESRLKRKFWKRRRNKDGFCFLFWSLSLLTLHLSFPFVLVHALFYSPSLLYCFCSNSSSRLDAPKDNHSELQLKFVSKLKCSLPLFDFWKSSIQSIHGSTQDSKSKPNGTIGNVFDL